MTVELAIILFSALAFLSILLYNPARTYGIPAMLIFIGAGIGLGNGGFSNFTYDFPEFTEIISARASARFERRQTWTTPTRIKIHPEA